MNAGLLPRPHEAALRRKSLAQVALLLANQFPDSLHVRDCGLKGQPDQEIWDYAQRNSFILVSKDNDFYQRSLLFGAPPKLVLLCIGNCTRQDIVDLLLRHENDLRAFESAPESVLLLS